MVESHFFKILDLKIRWEYFFEAFTSRILELTGLLREVTLHVLPAAAPSVVRVTVTPLQQSTAPGKPSGKVDVDVTLRDVPAGGAGVGGGDSVVLGLCWDTHARAPPCSDAQAYKVVNGVVSLKGSAVPGAKVWDPADTAPALHTLTVTVHAAAPLQHVNMTQHAAVPVMVDSCQVRFGIRIVSRSGRHILVRAMHQFLR